MQKNNNVLLTMVGISGGAWGKDGQRQGMDRGIDIIVLVSRNWVRSFIRTILFFNVHHLQGLVFFLFYRQRS